MVQFYSIIGRKIYHLWRLTYVEIVVENIDLSLLCSALDLWLVELAQSKLALEILIIVSKIK